MNLTATCSDLVAIGIHTHNQCCESCHYEWDASYEWGYGGQLEHELDGITVYFCCGADEAVYSLSENPELVEKLRTHLRTKENATT